MAEINVTPLVDVMLVLLIIFMVTAPLLTAAVPVNLPETRAKPMDNPEREPVQLSVTANETIYIGEEPVSAAELPARLEAIKRADAGADPPRHIMLRADKSLVFGRVAWVRDRQRGGGGKRVPGRVGLGGRQN